MPRLAFPPLLLSALAVTACTVGPEYKRPEIPVAPEWRSTATAGDVDPAWWRSLGDDTLARLVEEAAARNLDVREAEARLREARASRDATRGGRLPEISAAASATRNRLSENGQIPIGGIPGFKRDFSLFDGGFDANWEIDLWGRTRRSIEAAEARVGSAEEARHDTLLRVAAEVARSYVDLRGAQAQLASAQADGNAQASIARLTAERANAGEASRFDQMRAEGQARATRAAIPALEADARSAAYRLALLTGRPPEALAAEFGRPTPLPRPPEQVAAGLRSDLLRRRPDIRQAERDMAAYVADVGVATADLFPRFSLLGSIGQQARSTGDLDSGASTRFQIGPSLSWPIFSGGRVRAQIRAADARADAAAARYERAVLSALNDSETALNRYAGATETSREQEAARALSARSLALAEQRYRAGEDDLLILLNAQSAYSLAERQSIAARVQQLSELVALYKSLGGGWQALDKPDGTSP